MKEGLHIALSANERYMIGALAAASGVAVNARPDTQLVIHIFTEQVKQETIALFENTLRRLHPKCLVKRHDCDEQLLSGLPYWAGSRMAAVRCHYASLMPDVDWCLYLDCDVLYLASVEEHFSYQDDSVYACVVIEESENTRAKECAWIRENVQAEGGPLKVSVSNYFNSGVMLFNFKKMRHDGVPEKLVRFFKDHPDVPSPDQDALNATLNGCVRMIPPRFNRLQIFLTDEKLKDCPVIHYVSGNPWLPKLGVVANRRFRLWHAFADKYIWRERGASYRKCFTKRILAIKYVFYWLLKTPVVGRLFARVMQIAGATADAQDWRGLQIRADEISFEVV